MPTSAQITANQKNAQLSTGPTSETGKAKSSMNAVKTGLTGRTILLPSDDAALYETHIAEFFKRYEPAEDGEGTWSNLSPTPNGACCASLRSKWAFTPSAVSNSPNSSPTRMSPSVST